MRLILRVRRRMDRTHRRSGLGCDCYSKLSSRPTRRMLLISRQSDGSFGHVSRAEMLRVGRRKLRQLRAGKTEDDIDTWSYRHGIALGYIPSDVSNSSQLVFPILASGCVDSSFNYTAPSKAGVSAAERKEINRCFGLLALMSAVTWWNLGTIAKF